MSTSIHDILAELLVSARDERDKGDRLRVQDLKINAKPTIRGGALR